MAERYAVVAGARTRRELEAYLPDNYRIVHVTSEPRGIKAAIAGSDDHGWGLDTYVIPRLASGLIFARECASRAEAVAAAAAAMH